MQCCSSDVASVVEFNSAYVALLEFDWHTKHQLGGQKLCSIGVVNMKHHLIDQK